MGRKLRSEIAVVLTVLLVIACMSVIVFFLWRSGVPTWLVAIEAVSMLIPAIGLPYYAVERIKEIEDGEEDAVDNY